MTPNNNATLFSALLLIAATALWACDADADDPPADTVIADAGEDLPDTGASPTDTSSDVAVADATEGEDVANDTGDDAADTQGDDADDASTQRQVGFEILEIKGMSEFVVWLGLEVTREEFDALELPGGWIKNQPRETEPDGGSFARSPDATMDGEFTDAEHFGFAWRHNATVIEANTALDPEGLLRLNRIAKFHEVRFDAGRTLYVLVSPDGERYVRISRDANRTQEVPTLPNGWEIVEQVIADELTFDLPNPTVNIRCDNEDSFQGPVTELDGL